MERSPEFANQIQSNNEQNFSSYNLVLEVPNEFYRNFREQIKSDRCILNVLNVYKYWSHSFASDPSCLTDKDINTIQRLDLKAQALLNLNSFYDLYIEGSDQSKKLFNRQVARFQEATKSKSAAYIVKCLNEVQDPFQKAELLTKLRRIFISSINSTTKNTLDKNLNLFPANIKQETLRWESLSDVFLLPEKFDNIFHQIKNRLTVIIGYRELSLNNPAFKDRFIRTLVSFDNYMDTVPIILSDKYPQEQISTPRIRSHIMDILSIGLEPYQIKTEVGRLPGKISQTSVKWSDEWLSVLLHDIIQNTAKAYTVRDELIYEGKLDEGRSTPKNLMVNFAARKYNDKRYFIISFEDNGKGFPQDMLNDKGEMLFTKGVSNWESSNITGTGLGMADNDDVLRRYYEGQIIGRNRFNSQNEIIGANITVMLPL